MLHRVDSMCPLKDELKVLFNIVAKSPPLLVEKRKATLKVAELCKGAWCRRRSSHLFHLVVFRIAIHVGNQISVTSASSLLHGHDISIRRFPDLVHHVVVFCIFLVWDSCYTGSSLQAFQAPLSPTKLLLAIRSSYPRLNQFWPTDFCHLRRRSNFLICLIAIFGLNLQIIFFSSLAQGCFESRIRS